MIADARQEMSDAPQSKDKSNGDGPDENQQKMPLL
jgi:hypothetical protein